VLRAASIASRTLRTRSGVPYGRRDGRRLRRRLDLEHSAEDLLELFVEAERSRPIARRGEDPDEIPHGTLVGGDEQQRSLRGTFRFDELPGVNPLPRQ
jgi:hypothetical protein